MIIKAPKITRVQFDEAYRIGLARNDSANARGAVHRFNYRPTRERERDWHGMSAAAERTVAIETNRRWLSIGDQRDDPDAGDVEGGLQVRWTKHRWGHLLVHPDDRDHLLMVLVTGDEYPFWIIGCKPASACKRQEWWGEIEPGRPCYVVPNPLDSLIPWIKPDRVRRGQILEPGSSGPSSDRRRPGLGELFGPAV